MADQYTVANSDTLPYGHAKADQHPVVYCYSLPHCHTLLNGYAFTKANGHAESNSRSSSQSHSQTHPATLRDAETDTATVRR